MNSLVIKESPERDDKEIEINNKIENFEIKYKRKKIYFFIKQVIDFFDSLICILLLSWFMIIIEIVIKCTSNGPAIYVSEKIEKNGKTFKFYKFRSMGVGTNAEVEKIMSQLEHKEAFKMKNCQRRVTKVGKFLRKTSLDVLPQLFNILNGTMSIVGPCPYLPREYEAISEKENARLLVKQALTCIWQCSGRDNTSLEEQILMDLEYVNKRGFFYDLCLILKTIPTVLFSKGAE